MILNRTDKMLLGGLHKGVLQFMMPVTTARKRLMDAGYCSLNDDGYMVITEAGRKALSE